MLVYEKGTGENRHLYGTMANVPSESDYQLTYLDAEGQSVTVTLNDTYLDNGNGGIIQKSTQDTVNVFLTDNSELVNIIPGKNFVNSVVSIEVATPPTTTTYSVSETLSVTGMIVNANYADGDKTSLEYGTQYVTDPEDGYTFVAGDAGTKTVKVLGVEDTEFYGFEDTFDVTVS